MLLLLKEAVNRLHQLYDFIPKKVSSNYVATTEMDQTTLLVKKSPNVNYNELVDYLYGTNLI